MDFLLLDYASPLWGNHQQREFFWGLWRFFHCSNRSHYHCLTLSVSSTVWGHNHHKRQSLPSMHRGKMLLTSPGWWWEVEAPKSADFQLQKGSDPPNLSVPSMGSHPTGTQQPTGLACPASSSWPARILEQCPVSALHTSGELFRQKNPTNLALVDVLWVKSMSFGTFWHQKSSWIQWSPLSPYWSKLLWRYSHQMRRWSICYLLKIHHTLATKNPWKLGLTLHLGLWSPGIVDCGFGFVNWEIKHFHSSVQSYLSWRCLKVYVRSM